MYPHPYRNESYTVYIFLIFSSRQQHWSISSSWKFQVSPDNKDDSALQLPTRHTHTLHVVSHHSKFCHVYFCPFPLSKCKCEQMWISVWAVRAALSVSARVFIQSSCCPVTLIASPRLLPPIMLGCNPHQLMTCQGFHVISQPFQETTL